MAELALDDAAFDDLYPKVIVPALAPHEAERQRLVQRFWLAFRSSLAVAAVIVIPLAIKTGDGDSVTLGLFIVLLGCGLAYLPLARFQKRCKSEALTALSDALGMTYSCDGFEPPRLDRLRALQLLPSWDKALFEDLFTGARRGSAFQLYEASLTEGSGKEEKTVFRGQVICVAFPKKFLGTTVVDRNTVRRPPQKGLQRVGLESSQFERVFEVYGTDQVEARYLVHPAFMERLTAIEAANAGKNLCCAFDDGDLMITIEGSDLFEIIDVFKTIPDRDETRKGVGQIAQVLGLIDAVMDPPGRVYGSDSPPSSSSSSQGSSAAAGA